jgi:type II secretory pathway component PulF
MTHFAYRAIAADGSNQSGTLQADNEAALENTLRLRGLTLIESHRRLLFLWPTGGRNGRRFADADLLEFTYLLMLVNSSGIPLLEGLSDVLSGRERSRLEPVFEALVSGLKSGQSLSGVMRTHREYFPAYYSQVIRAGEVSGTLDKSINYLMSYLDWQINFKQTVRTFLRYPLLILSLLGALTAILFTFVFPSLGGVLQSLQVELPLPTVVIFSIAAFFRAHFVIILALLIAAVICGRFVISSERGRTLVDMWLLRTPLIGDLIVKINLSRYFKTLATLMAAGMDIQSSFSSAAEVTGNLVLGRKLQGVTTAVINGEDISTALRNIRLIQPLVISMVVIGEKTGNLDGALSRASEIFDKEVPETIKKVFAFVEPLTIVILGLMLLVVLLSIFLPIYSVVGNLRVR